MRGNYIWGCWLLNSRPSELDEVQLYLDKRLVPWVGDPFDFVGTPGPGGTGGDYGGADASDTPPNEGSPWPEAGLFEDHVRFWVGRGDQTSPPRQFLEDAPWATGGDEELWQATDAWTGRTVIWIRLRAGSSGKRAERWPAYPPRVEVEGKWSKVWDPRDPLQDPDDESTWTWSDNHALCVLDAHRTNPIRQWRLPQLLMDTWTDGADVADEIVPLKSGGSERRYRAAGIVTFDEGEIEDQINPLVLSGAADLIDVGGRRGIAPGSWRPPAMTVTEVLGDSLEVTDLIPGADLVNQLRVSYLSPERGYETARPCSPTTSRTR